MSVPIIIHLLARRRFKRVRWAAVEFLLTAEKKNRRRVKLEEWLLLALRCLAVLLIALLIARPFLTPSGIVASLSGRAQTERIILIDDSFSMGYVSEGVSLFTHAKRSVRRLIELIREESPDDTVTIFRMTQPGSPMERGTFLDDRQTPELLARLESLSISQLAMDPTEVIEHVNNYLSRSEDIINAAVYVVSDFQKKDWLSDRPGDDETGGAVLKPLMAWSGDDHDLQLVLIDVGVDEASNMAVTDVRVTGGQLVTGAEATLRAKVANFSDSSAVNLDVSSFVGNVAQPTKTIPELVGGLTTSVDLNASFVTAGYETVRVSIPPDSLDVDNERHFVADVANSIRILIVNGEPSSDLFEDEVTYLSTALRPKGEIFSGNDVVVVDESELETATLSTYHAVIIANVYRVSEPAAERLEQFVRRGGGVIFYLGDQVDPGLYNATLFRDGSGLLPAKLGERVRGARPFHLNIVDRLHPIMRPLSLEGDPLGLSDIPFFEFFDCKPWDAGETLAEDVSSNGTDDEGETGMASASLARVLAVFRDDQDYPAIIERKFGQGQVLLVTTGADKEWHLWPNHPTYLPVMMELALHIAKRGVDHADYSAGVPIEMPIDNSIFESDVIVRTPAYPTEREVVVTAKPPDDGEGLIATWTDTKRSGVYQFVLKRRDEGQTIRLVSVNLDTRESDVASANESELRQANEGVPIEYVDGVEALSGEVGNPRTEMWRLVLLAVVATLLFEQFLAWSWGRKR